MNPLKTILVSGLLSLNFYQPLSATEYVSAEVDAHKLGDCKDKVFESIYLPHENQLFVSLRGLTAKTSQADNVTRERKNCSFKVSLTIPKDKQLILNKSGLEYIYDGHDNSQSSLTYRARPLGTSSEAYTMEMGSQKGKQMMSMEHQLVLNQCGEENSSIEVKINAVARGLEDPDIDESGTENSTETVLSVQYFQGGFQLMACPEEEVSEEEVSPGEAAGDNPSNT